MDTKSVLLAETSSAVVLLRAAKTLLGDFSAWEPESLWVDLERQGVDLPLVNRDKLMAAVALDLMPTFYWDAIVFEKTALAFNDISMHPDFLEEARPEYLAWAIDEAARIQPGEFDHEPKVYAATVLYRAGLVLAPPQLSFCQEALDRLTKDLDLKKRVIEAAKCPIDHPFEETPLDVQRAHLTAIAHYVAERLKQENTTLP